MRDFYPMKSPENIKLTYLYRDASNYKAWGDVIFTNQEGSSLQVIEKSLTGCFLDGIFFVASQVGIPEVFLFHEYPFSEDDHFFHEFFSVECSNDQATDPKRRSAKMFIDQCKRVSRRGWQPKRTEKGGGVRP
jgi:hypothetical protein